MVAFGACSALTDQAVRLSDCINQAAKEVHADGLKAEVSCRLGSQSPYTVVLHPSGNLSDGQLRVAGLNPEQVNELKGLRNGHGAAVYVLSAAARERSSRTTALSPGVVIPFLLVAPGKAGETGLEVVVSESTYGVRVAAIHYWAAGKVPGTVPRSSH